MKRQTAGRGFSPGAESRQDSRALAPEAARLRGCSGALRPPSALRERRYSLTAARLKPRPSAMRSTTILCVRRDGRLAMGGDGQVTMGENIVKQRARKIRRLFNEKVLAGFAGSTADALSLFTRFEQKLEEYHGNLNRAVVELAKDWRTDRALRHLEALLLVADEKSTYLVSGNGDVIEPDDGIVAIGSGGPFALAAARALAKHTAMTAKEIVEEAMRLAGQICIFTNDQVTIEEL